MPPSSPHAHKDPDHQPAQPARHPAPDLPTQIEAHPCPTCAAPSGSACRTASGDTAFRYHTARLLLVPELTDPEVLVPADRAPGTPWQSPQSPHTDERFGYASGPSAAATRTQHDVLRAQGCAHIFADHTPLLAAARPERDRALSAASAAATAGSSASAARPDAPGRATHVSATLTVVALADLARNASELAEVATALAASGVRLEILDGPLAGVHDPHLSTAATLFTVLGAARMLDLTYARERNAAGRRAAEAEGRRSGRPRVIDDALLAQAIALRDEGMPVPQIVQRLVIASGKNAGEHPSLASVYRALATYDGTTEPKRVTV